MSTKHFDLNRLKYINKKSVYAVTNYIRNAQSLLPSLSNNYYNIPDGIIKICILFFGNLYELDDEWISKNFEIINNQISVKMDTVCAYNYAYFTNIICSVQHEWTFRIKKIKTLGHNHDFFFGIKSEQVAIQTIGHFDSAPTYYLMAVDKMVDQHQKEARIYNETENINNKYGLWIKENDIVTMNVDFDKLELKYTINDIDCGVATKIKAGKYRAVIMMYDIGDSIQLL